MHLRYSFRLVLFGCCFLTSQALIAGRIELDSQQVFQVPTRCDVNNDGRCDCDDIDDLSQAIADGVNDDKYDLNDDGEVDAFDRELLITGEDFFEGTYGDINFDGQFNINDLIEVEIEGHYSNESGAAERISYCHGDWNGDGIFNSADIVFVFENGQFVPESSHPGLTIMFVGLLGMTCRTRWKK